MSPHKRLALAAALAVSAFAVGPAFRGASVWAQEPDLGAGAQVGVGGEARVASDAGDAPSGATDEQAVDRISAAEARQATGRTPGRNYNVDEELGLLLDTPYAGATAATQPPLMSLLDQAGLAGPLNDARIRLYGYVQGSYTFNFDDPEQDLNLGRVFDIEHSEPTLNQISLTLERVVDPNPTDFDIGGRVQLIYGTDARFLHATGLLDHNDPEFNEEAGAFDTEDITDGSENQFDPLQFYVDLGLPVGEGLRVRAGRFLFFKQVDPNASVFYSHSFTFGGALPFTLTGITGYYEFGDQWGVEAGVVHGWDDAFGDENDAPSYLGRVRYQLSDRTTLSLSGITGPELENNSSDFRTVFDFVVAHRATDRLTFLLDAVYGQQTDAPVADADVADTDDAQWYGLSGYALYRVDDRFTVAARLEAFRDNDGFEDVLAVPTTLYGATVGVTITPFPEDPILSNLKVRPEIRYDYSTEDFFDGLTENDQITAAVDAFFNF